jgi:hypothetical protein
VFSKVAIATDENEVTKKKRGRPAGLKAKKWNNIGRPKNANHKRSICYCW